MRISVAQTSPVKGDIPANILAHMQLIALAISCKADSIFFPELSLTGYEPGLAKDLAMQAGDQLFNDFQQLSDANNITIGLGMPTKTNEGIQISMLIFQPGAPVQTYSKQQLHSDEFPFFTNGDEQIIITVADKKIAPAICYESLQNDHAANASKLGAEIYLASVAKSQNGIDKAMVHYPAIAKQYSMPVLMANCVGHCDNFLSVGQTAVWTKNGELAAQLNNTSTGILIFDTETAAVTAQTL